MANVRSIPPCKPARFRRELARNGAAVCTTHWRNQDAMSHDRQLQSPSEATKVRWTVDICHPTACSVSSGTAPPRPPHGRRPVKLRPRSTQGTETRCLSIEGRRINHELVAVWGWWMPRVVVPKKASCFPQLGSSCMCPFAACLAEPLIGGRGARDLEGGAPSLRLDTSPAAPTRMDAQVMSIKDTSRTTLCGPKERGHGLCRDRTQAQPHSARRRAVLVAVMRRPGLTGLLTSDFDRLVVGLVLFDAARRKRGHVRGRGLGPSSRDTRWVETLFQVNSVITT